MGSRLKTLGFVFIAAACATLAGSPGIAQEEVQKAGADASGGGGTGGGPTRNGSDTKGSDTSPTGEGGAGQNHPHDGDALRSSTSTHVGPSKQGSELGVDSSRKGVNAPTGKLGTTPGAKGVTLDHGIDLITPSDGYAGLQRRAMRKALTANAPKKPAGMLANTGTNPQFTRPGADSQTMHNAVGVVVPGNNNASGTGSGHFDPGFMAGTRMIGVGTRATSTGAIGATGAAGGGVGMDLHRPTIPLNTVGGPTAHAAGINGTTMSHIASGPGSVGGPAKDRSGINGTILRPKH
jgi:hypothetical protein